MMFVLSGGEHNKPLKERKRCIETVLFLFIEMVGQGRNLGIKETKALNLYFIYNHTNKEIDLKGNSVSVMDTHNRLYTYIFMR